jgi:hypothetical protein
MTAFLGAVAGRSGIEEGLGSVSAGLKGALGAVTGLAPWLAARYWTYALSARIWVRGAGASIGRWLPGVLAGAGDVAATVGEAALGFLIDPFPLFTVLPPGIANPPSNEA